MAAAISVVVPATDRPSTLAACLAALEAAGPDEVIVVDAPGRRRGLRGS